MNGWNRLGVIVLTASALFGAPQAQAADPWRGSSPAVVFEWNQLMQDTAPAALGPLQFRYYAILHVAMFDAANAVQRDFDEFHASVPSSSGASAEAAAAQAAHDVMVGLIPANKALYDATLAARLAAIPPGRARQGSAVGRAVAAKVLAWRSNDGISATPPTYVLPPLPGLWQPATPGQVAGLTQLPGMIPFALVSGTQFMPPRHPELTSARYTLDFNEVKTIGSATSATRTPEQTQLAQLFGGVITRTGVQHAWSQIARDAAISRGLGLVETARLYALMTVSMIDGLLTTQTSKFRYGLWRPITAIRRAGEDLNPDTTADPGWGPLIPTPPYPSYAGNMACLGASAARALALGIGTNDVPFTVLWRGNTGNPDVPKSYAGFWQFAEDEADSRIYGGIHFRFDNDVSQLVCSEIAEYVHDHFMRRR